MTSLLGEGDPLVRAGSANSSVSIRYATTAIGQLLLGNEESAAVRDRLVAGTGGLIGLKIAFSGLSFLVTVLLAHLLGTKGLGMYSYAFAWVVLLGIPAILGMDQLLVRQIASYEAKSEWGLLRGVLRTANLVVLTASAGLAFAAAAAAWTRRGVWSTEMLATFWLALVLLPLMALTRVRQGAMQGLHRVALGSVPEQLIRPALLVAFLYLAPLFFQRRLTAPLAMGLNVLAVAAAFLVGTQLLFRALPQPAREAAPLFRSAWLRSGIALVFLAGLGVVFAQADTLILGMLKGAEAVGVYSVADKGAELINFILIAQCSALAPTAASLHALGDLDRLQRLVTTLARWTLLASLPLAVVLIGFGHWFLLYCYGSQFTQARWALAILGLGQLANVGAGAGGMLLMMTGHERDAAIAIAAGAAANVTLNVALIPRWGLEGAACANALSMVLWNVLMAAAVYRKLGIRATAFARPTLYGTL